MEQSEFYRDGYEDYISGKQYRAKPMSMRLANSPWNEYDRGWSDAQTAVAEQARRDIRNYERRFLND